MPELIEGRVALVVIDMQNTGGMAFEEAGIPTMPGFRDRVERIGKVVQAARDAAIPVVFFQEVHRPDRVDFGRELDGDESVHCIEGAIDTELVEELRPRQGEYLIQKRRYSGFFGTDFQILLRGLKVDTLILAGELTDVCVHYTFVDAHQNDYFTRVIEDCCGGSTIERHQAALSAMEYLQRGARRTSAEIIAAFHGLGSRHDGRR